MDFHESRYYQRRARGRGRGRRGYRGYRGAHKHSFRPSTTHNYDTISCKTHHVEENRLIDTNPDHHKGWKKYSATKKVLDKSKKEEDIISIQSETLGTRDHRQGQYNNEWESQEDKLTNSLKKTNRKQHKNKRRNILSDKNHEKTKVNENISLNASDLTKNSQSEGFAKPEDSKVVSQRISSPKKKENDTKLKSEKDTKAKLSKKPTRPFIPKDRRSSNILSSSYFQLKFQMESKEIAKSIRCDLLKNPDKSRETVVIGPSDTIIGIEISKILDSIISEIKTDLDLGFALHLYIKEVLQNLIQEGKLFREFLSSTLN
ncbi:unnamed protein product [Moneuplotes crassus]|uniref:Uncharacterized protein n=1 Tax=Euplotes crassus TaxID=5936 RepID=A0AAD1XLX1_EUPCR|nr:unnamed protein product [Moneuplotes crassus]